MKIRSASKGRRRPAQVAFAEKYGGRQTKGGADDQGKMEV